MGRSAARRSSYGSSFTRSMLVSLPVAVLLTLVIATFILRSLKYAVVSVAPILLVDKWIDAIRDRNCKH